MPEGVKKALKLIGGIISPLIFVFGLIANMVTVLPEYKNVIDAVLIGAVAVAVIYSVYHIYETNKIRILKKETVELCESKDVEIAELSKCKTLLEQKVSGGVKMLRSDATIIIDISKNMYHLQFEKEYIVISNNPEWYAGQFYCNKILDSAERAQEYYKNNNVSWEDLDVKAYLSYKNLNDTDFSPTLDVFVKYVAEGNNFKEFHIEYKTTENEPLDIKHGSIVRLKYTYDVPTSIWGTYLNRYMSYWKEDAKVSIVCSEKKNLSDCTLKVYSTNEMGKVVLLPDVYFSKTDRLESKQFYRQVTIPSNMECCKYIVWWDAKAFWGANAENTEIGSDDSRLTRY